MFNETNLQRQADAAAQTDIETPLPPNNIHDVYDRFMTIDRTMMALLACLSAGSVMSGAALNAGTGVLGATILQSTGGYSHLDKVKVAQASAIGGAFSFPIVIAIFLHLRNDQPDKSILIVMLCHLMMTMETCQFNTIVTQDELLTSDKLIISMFTGYAALTATAVAGTGLYFFGKRIANALSAPAPEPLSDLTLDLI